MRQVTWALRVEIIDIESLSCIITGGPAPILRSVIEVSPKKWRILMKNDAISMTTGP